MSNRRHDYDLLEREYVSGEMGLRELARNHGISHSLVMDQSQKRKWAEKREQFRQRASESAVTFMADREGFRRMREMEVRDHAVEMIDDAIAKLRVDMKATELKLVNDEWVEVPVYRLRPQDIVILIDRMNVLFGRPSQITEDRSLGLTLDTGRLGPEALREFIDATRGLGSVDGGAGRSPIPRTDRTREN